MTDQPPPGETPAQTSEPAPPVTPAGWYPTPDGKQRYWDGTRWTDLPWEEPAAPVPTAARGAAGFLGLSSKMFAIVVAAAVVVLAAIVVSVIVAVTPKAPMTFTAHGTFVLTDTDDAGACIPPDGYSDIVPGAQVIIKSDGKTLAIGGLSKGKVAELGIECDYTFTVKHVPLGHKFYEIEISHRGFIEENAHDIEHGIVGLTLGS
jgi:hypothetical protein